MTTTVHFRCHHSLSVAYPPSPQSRNCLISPDSDILSIVMEINIWICTSPSLILQFSARLDPQSETSSKGKIP